MPSYITIEEDKLYSVTSNFESSEEESPNRVSSYIDFLFAEAESLVFDACRNEKKTPLRILDSIDTLLNYSKNPRVDKDKVLISVRYLMTISKKVDNVL